MRFVRCGGCRDLRLSLAARFGQRCDNSDVTVMNGVLLRPPPCAEPDRLFALREKTEKATQFGNLWSLAYPNFLDRRK